MQALLTIGHRQYLVPCAKKALAFAEFMGKAREVDDISYSTDTIKVRAVPVEVTVETLRTTAKITMQKTKAEN